MDPLAENHHEFTPYNYVLGNPVKYADFMGLDTINVAPNSPISNNAKAGDVLNDAISLSTVLEEVVINENVNSRRISDLINPPQNINTSVAGSFALGLRAGPVGALVVGAVAITTILPNLPQIGSLPQNLPPAPGFGDPSKWEYTYRPSSLDPINNPPQGFDPNEPLKDLARAARWLFYGKILYELYDEYDSHMEKLKPISSDNTRVVNPQIKKPNRK